MPVIWLARLQKQNKKLKIYVIKKTMENENSSFYSLEYININNIK